MKTPRFDQVRARRCGGFSLLEVVVAVAVLLIGLLAAFGAHLHSADLIESSRDSSIASDRMEAAMDQIVVHSAAQIPLRFPENVPLTGVSDFGLREHTMVPSYPNYSGSGPVPQLLEIAITSTWLDGRGRPMRLRYASSKSR